ncbi:uncharacterized protein HD556DRAFT_1525515 [Suillus plorans]|uniref:DUF6533 domain-containing protein n=1 Tax=Suillus plorans TaxID=116603 RepID=A0A9P7DMF2_9AGAM|nr:uncharacterized protein HD556DRAFT_1525515 [Suillus plorans]KAG1798444.1 hypothetical protein HD556DRAFT_1525515 [Suillus plorans]
MSLLVNSNRFSVYWMIAAGVVVVYDWVLTLGQEIELIWGQRWSFMTVLYLLIRYVGLPYSVIGVLIAMPSVSLTDTVGIIADFALCLTSVVVLLMLGIIMIARLHAMYHQRSRIMLISLVIFFLAVNIACVGLTVTICIFIVPSIEEGNFGSSTNAYACNYGFEGDAELLSAVYWMPYTIWEFVALYLSVRIAVKHFRDLRRLGPLTGSTIGGDCFRVLMKSHVLYFASFFGASCLQFVPLPGGFFSPYLEPEGSYSVGDLIIYGALQIFFVVQMFVLGPRLILSIREYHAKLVAGSDAEISMNSIVFQERVHVETSSIV